MCNYVNCPDTKEYGTCCLCNWTVANLKCKYYECDPSSEYCSQRLAEDSLLAKWESEQELPEWIIDEENEESESKKAILKEDYLKKWIKHWRKIINE